jgi:hypothetical protein
MHLPLNPHSAPQQNAKLQTGYDSVPRKAKCSSSVARLTNRGDKE